MGNARRAKVRWARGATLKCGHHLPVNTVLVCRRTSHAADNVMAPVICPECRSDTFVDRREIRSP